MPRASWTKKDERQYKAIVKNCTKPKKVCQRIAAATVNKRRTATKGNKLLKTIRKGGKFEVKLRSKWVPAVYHRKSRGKGGCIIASVEGKRGRSLLCGVPVRSLKR